MCLQIYDTGSIEGSFGSFQVGNVQGYGGFVLHIGSIAGGAKALSVGDKVICKVKQIKKNISLLFDLFFRKICEY